MNHAEAIFPRISCYLAGASWLLVEKIIRLACGLLVGVWLARYLGPTNFGTFSYALNVVALLAGFLSLGIDNLIVREIVKAPESESRLLGTAFGMRAGGLVVSAVLVVVMLANTHASAETRLLVGLIWLSTLFQLSNLIELHFQAHGTVRHAAIANAISNALSVCLKATLIWYEAPLALFAAASIAETLIQAICLIYVFRREGRRISTWSFDRKIAAFFMREGWPLFVAAIAVAVYAKIDQILIEALLSTEAVGLYAAATRISEAWFFIPVIICNALLPSVVTARSESKEACLRLQIKIFRGMILLGILVALPVTLLSKEIVQLLYGDPYSATSTVLSVHIWSGLFVGLGTASSLWLISEGLTRYSLYRTAIGCIANISSNLLLIPTFGLTGAACSALVGYFIATFGLLFFPKTRACGVAMLLPVLPAEQLDNHDAKNTDQTGQKRLPASRTDK